MLNILGFLNELDVTFVIMLHVIVLKCLFDYKITTYTFEFMLDMIVLKFDFFNFYDNLNFCYHVKHNFF